MGSTIERQLDAYMVALSRKEQAFCRRKERLVRQISEAHQQHDDAREMKLRRALRLSELKHKQTLDLAAHLTEIWTAPPDGRETGKPAGQS